MADILDFRQARRSRTRRRRHRRQRQGGRLGALWFWLPVGLIAAWVFLGGFDAASLTRQVYFPGHVGLCSGAGWGDCVIDGDTIRFDGDKIRLEDIDAPETHSPRCREEAELGRRATLRLVELMNEGPVELLAYGGRDTDRYGRKLRTVSRDGWSLGDQLVAEGLARPWEGARRSWC